MSGRSIGGGGSPDGPLTTPGGAPRPARPHTFWALAAPAAALEVAGHVGPAAGGRGLPYAAVDPLVPVAGKVGGAVCGRVLGVAGCGGRVRVVWDCGCGTEKERHVNAAVSRPKPLHRARSQSKVRAGRGPANTRAVPPPHRPAPRSPQRPVAAFKA